MHIQIEIFYLVVISEFPNKEVIMAIPNLTQQVRLKN